MANKVLILTLSPDSVRLDIETALHLLQIENPPEYEITHWSEFRRRYKTWRLDKPENNRRFLRQYSHIAKHGSTTTEDMKIWLRLLNGHMRLIE